MIYSFDLESETPEPGSLISGIRVRQHKDFTFSWHMNEYVDKSLRPVEVRRGFISQSKEAAEEVDDMTMSDILFSPAFALLSFAEHPPA